MRRQKKRINDIISRYEQEVVKENGRIPTEMWMLGILERFGWTYDEYMDTPEFIIELIQEKDGIDYRARKLKEQNGSTKRR